MIIDLRDYRTTPGCRDRLIERCERRIFDEQRALGAAFPGSFRDASDPDRFVWLRAFRDLPARATGLTAYYGDGASWRSQRAEVNRWIADSDDVLLVRPLTRFAAPARGRSAVGLYALVGPREPAPDQRAWMRHAVAREVRRRGGRLLVTLAVDPAPNNYPRHPIREGERGLVWLASYPSLAAATPLGLLGLSERRLVPTRTSRLR